MNIETYEKMLNADQIDTAVTAAEKEYKNTGSLIDAVEGLKALRKKYFE